MTVATNIPAPRVPFIDQRTGLMAREWYMFFVSLFTLTGSGGTNQLGTVTSIGLTAPPEFDVDNSPVTASGTIDLGWIPQPANSVLMGPISGAPDEPTFRSIQGADLPPLPYVRISGDRMTGTFGFDDAGNLISILFDPPDATSNAELQLYGGEWITDFDNSEPTSGVRMGGAYLAFESSDISMQLNDAQVGSRVVVAGLTERGNAILAAEPPPVPDYIVQATNSVDVIIYNGGPTPGPWVDVCDLLVIGQDIQANSATIYLELLVENIGTKGGEFEIGISLNGATPLPANTVTYTIGVGVTQIYANTAINAAFLPNGTTARLQARALSTTGAGFSLIARNSVRQSLLKIVVVGGGGGLGAPQPAGTAYMGPISGPNASPTFRRPVGTDVLLPSITPSLYGTLQDFVNVMHSPGIIRGGALSNPSANNLTIAAGQAILRIADDDVSTLRFTDFGPQNFVVPTDGFTRFFGLTYNAGAPTIVMRTTDTWDNDTEIMLGSAAYLPGPAVLVTFSNPFKVGDPLTNIIQRFDADSRAIRDNGIGGLTLADTAGRIATLSAGTIWARLNNYSKPARASNTAPMLAVSWGGAQLVVTPGQTQWDNTRFNNVGAGTLDVMINNRFACLWFFTSIEANTWGWAYGTNQYTSIGNASLETFPAYLTTAFNGQTMVVGRMIFQKSAATASVVESAFTTPFVPAPVNNHNDLAALDGGAVGQYYHLTQSDFTDLTALAALATVGFIKRTGEATYTAGDLVQTTPTTLGYGVGAGGTVTQLTNKNTTVTINKPCGLITLSNSALGANTPVEFAVLNSTVGIADVIAVNCNSNTFGPSYRIEVRNVVAGAFALKITNITAGALSDAVPINFVVIRGAAS